MPREDDAFTYDGGRVAPGETQEFRYSVSETYLGDPLRIPVTVMNGVEPGPTLFLSGAVHGDELNGIEVVREIALQWDHDSIHGTVVCLPVLNVPGFVVQERYLPIYDRDLNRAFPGSVDGTSSSRIAHQIFRNFIEPCDVGIDLHTSTRGRSNVCHVRANMADEEVAELAEAFGTNLIIHSEGSPGMLRHEATTADIPTITVEMGEAHRFERGLIDEALAGVERVAGHLGIRPDLPVEEPAWRTVVEGWEEKTWLRADAGGLVEMRYERGAFVEAGAVICRITNPFKSEWVEVEAPFSGMIVGVLENPVVYPGNPLVHLVKVDEYLPAGDVAD